MAEEGQEQEKVVAGTETPELTPEQQEAEAVAAKAAEEEKSKEEKIVTEPEVEEGVILEGWTRDEEGNILVQLGNSVYKGKTEQEVWANVQKGEKDKDHAFAELKAKEAIVAPKPAIKAKESVEDQPIGKPDINLIAAAHFQKHPHLKIDMARWDSAKWNDYMDAEGKRDHEITELRSQVKAVLSGAWAEHDEDNVEYNNAQAVDAAADNFRKMVVRAGFENPDEYADVYATACERCLTDPKFQDEFGQVLKGAIETEAAQELFDRVNQKTKKVGKVEQHLEKEKEEQRKLRVAVKTGSGTNKPFKLTTKVAANISDARKAAQKDLASGRL